MLLRIPLGALVVAAAVPSLSSQTLYTIHGGTPATATITELKGPPGLPLGYPGGPVVASFPTTLPFACATVGPLAPPPFGVLGDVAFDTVADVVWATDGTTITSYTPAGAPIVSFPVPAPLGPLTGLGFNSAAGVLIMTDGALIAGAVTFGAGCVVPIVGPGMIPSPAPGLLTDIEWDPLSGTFFGCDTLGFVTGYTPAGVLVFELVFGVANLVEHGNVELPRRIDLLLRRALITPALHRAHHASEWSELNTNFGTVLSLWDRLAGTFRESEPGRRVATGLPDRRSAAPPTLPESLLLPFTRQRAPA